MDEGGCQIVHLVSEACQRMFVWLFCVFLLILIDCEVQRFVDVSSHRGEQTTLVKFHITLI